jgi:TM2 domain-containing membrane protein YozV
MANEEYVVEKKKVDSWLIVILVFLGWLGIDKFYYAKSFKNAWKFALVKLLFNCIFVGVLWNLFDIVRACLGTYEFDFRDYFK